MEIYIEDQTQFKQSLISVKPDFNQNVILKGSTLILMDIQIPYQDGDFIYRMLNLASQWNIKQGISGGDFFNQAAFSFFLNLPKEMIWKEEAQKAAEVGSAMVKFVPKWTFIMGNHDSYLLKKVAHQLDHTDLLKLANMPRGAMGSDYYWCIVKDKRGNEWRVTHPRNVSVLHGRVPQRLAIKYQQNIISGHGHLAGSSPDDGGKFYCIDAGVCCDPIKLDYAQTRDSTFPRMNRGAVILKEVNSKIIPYHILPEWADWEALAKMYC